MLGCVAYAAFRVSITVWPKKPSKAHMELNLKVLVSVKVFVIKILDFDHKKLGTWRDDNCLLLQKVCLLSLPQKMYFTPTQLPRAVDLVTGPEIQGVGYRSSGVRVVVAALGMYCLHAFRLAWLCVYLWGWVKKRLHLASWEGKQCMGSSINSTS